MDDYSELIGDASLLDVSLTLQADERDRPRLADLAGPGAELSTGLILTWRDKLVFGVEPRAIPLGAQGQADIAAFVGIGGHLDPGERWIDAASREALEEAGCAISLGDSPITYFCQEGHLPRPVAYAWAEPYRPLLVWTATFNLRRGPEAQRLPVTLVTAVFRAAALGQPTPGAEIQALLLMDQETLVDTYKEPRPLGELLERGAQYLGKPMPPDSLMAPGGSAYFYAQWLAWQESSSSSAIP